MRKIIIKILDFLKNIILFIISLFSTNKKTNKKEITKSPTTINKQSKKDNITSNNITSIPDTPHTKSNPHIKELLFTEEDLNNLIDEVIEEIYEEEDFKVKDADKDIQEKLDKLKEKIIPKIEEIINKKNIKLEKQTKEIIKDTLEEEFNEEPLLEIKTIIIEDQVTTPIIEPTPIVETTPTIEPTIKEDLEEVIKPSLITINEVEEILEKEDIPSIIKVDNIEEGTIIESSPIIETTPTIEEPSIIESTTPKESIIENPFKEEISPIINTTPIIEDNPTIETTPIIEDKKEIEVITIPPKEEIIENIKVPKESITEETTPTIEIKEDIKEKTPIIETTPIIEKPKKEISEYKIDNLIIESNLVKKDANKEINKKDFFDKNYTRIEKSIDRMLDKINNTLIRYEDKLSDKQKEKLEKEKERLRNTKENISKRKDKDIKHEKELLEEEILDTELQGLEEEIKNMHLEYNIKENEDLLNKMNNLQGMTKEQIKETDKLIILQRFHKIENLLAIRNLILLPFVKNIYFLYYTVGIMIDNHFGITHSFLNRRLTKYTPPDLTNIQNGKDSLNNTIDITYKNIIQLEYLEEEILSMYPDLKYDLNFMIQVNRIKNKLNRQYNKLINRRDIMDKYLNKGKKQKKILHIKDKAA